MNRGAFSLLPILLACHCAPATPPRAEVWIAPPQSGNAVAETAPAAAPTIEKHDGARYATVQTARAELMAAEHDLRRQEELCRLCGGLCGRDVQAAHDRYVQAEAELERAKAKPRSSGDEYAFDRPPPSRPFTSEHETKPPR